MGLPVLNQPAQADRTKQVLDDAMALLSRDNANAALTLLASAHAQLPTPLSQNGQRLALLYASVALTEHAPQRCVDALSGVLSTLPPAQAGHADLLLAHAFRQLGDVARALDHAQRAVCVERSPARLLALGDVLKHSGQLAAAHEAWAEAVSKAPDDVTARAQWVACLYLLDRRDDATNAHDALLALAQSALAQAPSDRERADVWRNLAYAAAVAGDTTTAVAWLQRALAVDEATTKAYIADEVEFRRLASITALADSL